MKSAWSYVNLHKICRFVWFVVGWLLFCFSFFVLFLFFVCFCICSVMCIFYRFQWGLICETLWAMTNTHLYKRFSGITQAKAFASQGYGFMLILQESILVGLWYYFGPSLMLYSNSAVAFAFSWWGKQEQSQNNEQEGNQNLYMKMTQDFFWSRERGN